MAKVDKSRIGRIILIGLMLLLMATILFECSKKTDDVLAKPKKSQRPQATYIPVETEEKKTMEPLPSPSPTTEVLATTEPSPLVKGEPGGLFSKHPDYYGKKVVSLTFDDGPHDLITDKLLDGLKERGVKATFFVTSLGKNDEDWESDRRILQRILDEGHEIGNHTQSHNHSFLTWSGDDMRKELGIINKIVEEMTGYSPKLFRTPGGNYNQKVLDESNMTLIDYSKDTRDSYYFNDINLSKYSIEHEVSMEEAKDILVKYVLDCIMGRDYEKEISYGNIGHGTIFLFHDVYEGTVDLALAMIDELLEDDFVFLTVSDAIESEGGKIEAGQHYKLIWEDYKTRIKRQKTYS